MQQREKNVTTCFNLKSRIFLFFVSSCVILPFVPVTDVLLEAKAPLGLLSDCESVCYKHKVWQAGVELYQAQLYKVTNSSAFVAVVQHWHLLRFADFHKKKLRDVQQWAKGKSFCK